MSFSPFPNFKGPSLWVTGWRPCCTFWDCPFWGGIKKWFYSSKRPLSSYPPGVTSSLYHHQCSPWLLRIIWKSYFSVILFDLIMWVLLLMWRLRCVLCCDLVLFKPGDWWLVCSWPFMISFCWLCFESCLWLRWSATIQAPTELETRILVEDEDFEEGVMMQGLNTAAEWSKIV